MLHFDVEGCESCNPAGTMYDVGAPAELAYGLDSSPDEENSAFIVNVGPVDGFVLGGVVAVEKIVIVDEVYLQTGGLKCCNLNDEGVVGVINDDVHARQTNHFMELIAALVYSTVFGHESAHFGAFFLKTL